MYEAVSKRFGNILIKWVKILNGYLSKDSRKVLGETAFAATI